MCRNSFIFSLFWLNLFWEAKKHFQSLQSLDNCVILVALFGPSYKKVAVFTPWHWRAITHNPGLLIPSIYNIHLPARPADLLLSVQRLFMIYSRGEDCNMIILICNRSRAKHTSGLLFLIQTTIGRLKAGASRRIVAGSLPFLRALKAQP